jgi:hypothetical protein
MIPFKSFLLLEEKSKVTKEIKPINLTEIFFTFLTDSSREVISSKFLGLLK